MQCFENFGGGKCPKCPPRGCAPASRCEGWRWLLRRREVNEFATTKLAVSGKWKSFTLFRKTAQMAAQQSALPEAFLVPHTPPACSTSARLRPVTDIFLARGAQLFHYCRPHYVYLYILRLPVSSGYFCELHLGIAFIRWYLIFLCL